MEQYEHLHDVFRRVLHNEPVEPDEVSEQEKDTQTSQLSTTSHSIRLTQGSGSPESTSPTLPTSEE